MDKEALKELQDELIEQEKITITMHSATIGVSLLCFLRLITLDDLPVTLVLSSSLFLVHILCFTHIVTMKYHSLHKGRGIHIAHVATVDDFSKKPRTIGLTALYLAICIALFHLSLFALIVGHLVLYGVSENMNKFREKLEEMSDAREHLEQ
ncbi:hypothetical protein QX216_22755 [Vibrio parahaemolyticus]|uniref:hypothetical protein n=1 Tax=Vibrio parahaemolyticus TaxID=670 RepID=UPI00287A5038|nr:hypothetical protein [Vibrio parahaemolyticus]EJG1621235.1 hypothetical protein [Vibrio parahaemolyticus]MDS1796920.1 hypothetical protein [Vibrio parahaemolyticus]MDS1944894.1 hypothetical protein [Vibrio parahaemolyticus]